MDVTLAEDQIVLSPHFNLKSLVDMEQDLISRRDAPNQRANRNGFGPAKALGHLGCGWDQNSRPRCPFALSGHLDQDAVRKHVYGNFQIWVLQWHISKVPFVRVLREPITIFTSDDLELEGELVSPDEPWAGAVLTHPHPRHGGNMRSMMPGELIKSLPELGVATLRFNFRGMGASQGEFEDGVGERLDTIAAIGDLHNVVEGLPIGIFGSSFGADTALTVDDPQISGWCAMAPPLRDHRLELMEPIGKDPRPKLLIVAERDQFRLPESVADVTKDWINTRIKVIDGADHFFIGKTDRVVAECEVFIRSLASIH